MLCPMCYALCTSCFSLQHIVSLPVTSNQQPETRYQQPGPTNQKPTTSIQQPAPCPPPATNACTILSPGIRHYPMDVGLWVSKVGCCRVLKFGAPCRAKTASYLKRRILLNQSPKPPNSISNQYFYEKFHPGPMRQFFVTSSG